MDAAQGEGCRSGRLTLFHLVGDFLRIAAPDGCRQSFPQGIPGGNDRDVIALGIGAPADLPVSSGIGGILDDDDPFQLVVGIHEGLVRFHRLLAQGPPGDELQYLDSVLAHVHPRPRGNHCEGSGAAGGLLRVGIGIEIPSAEGLHQGIVVSAKVHEVGVTVRRELGERLSAQGIAHPHVMAGGKGIEVLLEAVSHDPLVVISVGEDEGNEILLEMIVYCTGMDDRGERLGLAFPGAGAGKGVVVTPVGGQHQVPVPGDFSHELVFPERSTLPAEDGGIGLKPGQDFIHQSVVHATLHAVPFAAQVQHE